MKRWTLRISLMLILGAVTTVAVAWGFAAVSNLYVYTPDESFRGFLPVSRPTGELWTLMGNAGPGAFIVASIVERPEVDNVFTEASIRLELGEERRLIAPSWAKTAYCAPEVGVDTAVGFVAAYGWPGVAMSATFHDTSHNGRWGRNQFAVSGFSAIIIGPPRHGTAPPVVLPLRPILPGFLIDTLFYGAIWFGLFFGTSTARRTMRRRRGRCPTCAYDLRGDPQAGCPECGWQRPSGRDVPPRSHMLLAADIIRGIQADMRWRNMPTSTSGRRLMMQLTTAGHFRSQARERTSTGDCTAREGIAMGAPALSIRRRGTLKRTPNRFVGLSIDVRMVNDLDGAAA